MGFIEAMSVLFMPFAVKWGTDYVKKLGAIPMLAYRVALVRALVAVLAVVGAVLSQLLGDSTFDPSLLETAGLAILNAGVATWMYYQEKKNGLR